MSTSKKGLREYLKVQEVADLLGTTRQTISKYINRELIPCVRIGNIRRVRREDLDRIVSIIEEEVQHG